MIKISKWCVGIFLMANLSAQATAVWNDAFNVVSTVWSDGLDGAANTNLTVFLSGGGASVTQSGGQMVLNTVELDDGRQAAVSTASDETGARTSVNGAPRPCSMNQTLEISARTLIDVPLH